MASEEVICFLPRHFCITGFRAVIPWNRDLFASGHNRTWACTRHHTVKKLTPALAYLRGAPVFTHLSVQPAVHSKRTNKPLLLLPQAVRQPPLGCLVGAGRKSERHVLTLLKTHVRTSHVFVSDSCIFGGLEGWTFTGGWGGLWWWGRGGRWPTTSRGFCSISR